MKTFEEYMNLKVIKDILRSMAKGAVNQANINAQELQSVIAFHGKRCCKSGKY